MRLAIVHYHLHPGGITRVIENAVAGLARRSLNWVVLSGEPYRGKRLKKVGVLEGLAYRDEAAGLDPETLARQMVEKAREVLGGEPDLWHVHNHSLGKNVLLPAAICRLARSRRSILLQIHDFPEDGRSDNYERLLSACAAGGQVLGEVLYPLSANIHYAVLNARDLKFLRQAGVPGERLHYLPNPVALPNEKTKQREVELDAERLILYPSRGIRRKNLGEMILWSALAAPGDLFATSLRPRNPFWKPIHDRWARFAGERNLPVRFGIADPDANGIEVWMRKAEILLTTSIAEGFGLGFLEPFLFQRPLMGRNLPEITEDFSRAGINLGTLYNRLDVPLEIIGASVLRKRLEAAMRKMFNAYRVELPEDAVERALGANLKGGMIDFGFLDEPFQETVIDALYGSRDLRRAMAPRRLDYAARPEAVKQNEENILAAFNLENYGARLMRIYRTLASAGSGKLDFLAPDRLLRAFLAPERFRLLKT